MEGKTNIRFWLLYFQCILGYFINLFIVVSTSEITVCCLNHVSTGFVTFINSVK